MGTAETPRANEGLVDAKTALELLGVKPQTLYAYVSRGLIRAVNRAENNQSLYHREDIDALRLRGRTRAGHRNTAQRSLHVGGDAVMQTSTTQLTQQGPLYRGIPAIELAQEGRPLEDVAELLWTGVLPLHTVWWDVPALPDHFQAIMTAVAAGASNSSTRRVLSLSVEALALCNGRDAELRIGAAAGLAGRQVLQVMTGALGLLGARPAFRLPESGVPLSRAAALTLGAADADIVIEALNGALVICADHELAPSTFAARIAASVGADIYSCVSCALGGFEGSQTGFGCDRAEELLRESSTPARYAAALKTVANRKQPLPGYNHPLYPEGDPRAAFLLATVRRLGSRAAKGAFVLDCVKAARDQLNASPGLGVGLAGLALAMDLPPRSAGALMALGRCVGWTAHIFEQRLAGFLVRPSAEYVGPAAAQNRED